MRYVRGHGHTEPGGVMIIGEAPGAEEERFGRPFVGSSGRELDAMLQDAGIRLSEVYKTNVIRFRPPGNNIEEFVRLEKRKPEGEWVSFKGAWVKPFVVEHYEHLIAEIESISPRCIILTGNTPLWFVAGRNGITKWRGSQLRVEIAGKTYNVLPIIHPAAILRDWSQRAITVLDLRRVNRNFEPPDRQYIINPPFDHAMEVLESLDGKKIAIDIETSQKQIICIGFAWSPREAMCVPISNYDIEQQVAFVKKMSEILPRCKVVGQNLIYDTFYIAVWYGFIVDPYFDTMIAQNVLYAGLPKKLDYLASMYCEHYEYWKDDIKEWSTSSIPQNEQLWRYNATDCAITFEVSQVQEALIESQGLSNQFEFQMSLFRPTLEVMLRGVRLNSDLRENISNELTSAIKEREEWLANLFGHPVNPRSPKQLMDLFYSDLAKSDGRHNYLNIPKVKNRSTGKPTLNEEALDVIAAAEPLLAPAIKRIKEIRTLNILKSTFVEAEGPRDRFYCGYNIAGTSTYRFSSSANPFGWGTNGQNIPKWERDDPEKSKLPNIRHMFVPDDGFILWAADLVKADLHVVVWEADDDELREQLANGVNIYREATKIVDMPYTKAKSFIHGTNYGGSYRTMAISQKIPEAKAREAQAAWFARHPGIKAWHNRVMAKLEKTRSVQNAFGYRIIFFDRPQGILPEALAWIPQSTVACVINRAWMQIRRSVPEAQILLQVHDELVGQIHERYAHKLPMIYRCMRVIVPYERPLVIPWEFKVGQSWGEMTAFTPGVNNVENVKAS